MSKNTTELAYTADILLAITKIEKTMQCRYIWSFIIV